MRVGRSYSEGLEAMGWAVIRLAEAVFRVSYNTVLARSSGLPFNGIFPIIGLVLISQLCLNNIFWN